MELDCLNYMGHWLSTTPHLQNDLNIALLVIAIISL